MKYCDRCKVEYEDYIDICPDCGQALGPKVMDSKVDKEGSIKLMYLKNVDSDFEAERLIVLLGSEGIPALKKFKGTGSYLNIVAAVNYQGVDIYVSETDIESARLLIEPMDVLPDSYLEEIPFDDEDLAQSQQRGMSIKWMIRMGVIVPLVIYVLHKLWQLFNGWMQ